MATCGHQVDGIGLLKKRTVDSLNAIGPAAERRFDSELDRNSSPVSMFFPLQASIRVIGVTCRRTPLGFPARIDLLGRHHCAIGDTASIAFRLPGYLIAFRHLIRGTAVGGGQFDPMVTKAPDRKV